MQQYGVATRMPNPLRPTLLAAILLSAACSRQQPAPPPPPATSTTPDAPKPIPQREAVAGSSFNSVFPASAGDFKVTFTQEKDGFVQADLTNKGTRVAALTVSDTAANPTARDNSPRAPSRSPATPPPQSAPKAPPS